MAGEVRILFGKEWRQLSRSKGAILSALLLPILLLIIAPVPSLLGVTHAAAKPTPLPEGVHLPPGLEAVAQDPKALPLLMLPFLVMLAGLTVPMLGATYILINERESKTLELLVALPVTIGQVLKAKFMALGLMCSAVTLLLVGVDVALLFVTHLGTVAFALTLPVVLIASIAFSVCGAFLISLVARDFRTANNLNGALVVPAILVTFGTLALVPDRAVANLVIASVLAVAGAVVLFVALRVVTFERLLR